MSVTLASLGAAAQAQAQTFPTHDAWAPMYCASAVMTDKFNDELEAVDERDLVGDLAAPTGAITADAQFLYLRVRVEKNPIPEAGARPFGWGILIDTDRNLATYEVQVQVNGITGVVSLFRNTVVTLANSPADPPDEPAVAAFSMSSHARSVVAPGSSYGGDSDHFLEFAVPWVELEKVGITTTTPVVLWAATSTSLAGLNGDFACWDNGTGEPTLSGSGSRRTVLDPYVDSDDDGYTDRREYEGDSDPNNAGSKPAGDPDSLELAGAGGCQAAGGGLGLASLALAALWRRGSRAARRG